MTTPPPPDDDRPAARLTDPPVEIESRLRLLESVEVDLRARLDGLDGR